MTDQFSRKKPGDTMNILGPLGNVFSDWDRQDKEPVLVGGGVGLAPILNLYELCTDAVLIMGARTAAEHFMDHEPENHIYLTTDDGSAGIDGNVLTALNEIDLQEPNYPWKVTWAVELAFVRVVSLKDKMDK
jgi:dihydroorotate dehydrogenase electron transfer subunit